MKRLLSLAVLAMLFCLIPALSDARPANDPNAALRYLHAVGTFQDIPADLLSVLEGLETPEDLAKADPKAIAAMDDAKFVDAMKLLKLGAACPSCNFTPDATRSPSDVSPPYRRLRQLVRLGRAYSWLQASRKNPRDAAEMLESLFIMGEHMEDEGSLIGGMIGLAFRRIAVQAFPKLLQFDADPATAAQVMSFLKKVRRPSVDIPALLRFDKSETERLLTKAKTDDTVARDIHRNVFGFGFGITGASPSLPLAHSVESCRQNIRVLSNAWITLIGAASVLSGDMLIKNPLAESRIPLPLVIGFDYPLSVPACPQRGTYRISFPALGCFEMSCSRHGTADRPPETVKKALEELTREAEIDFRKFKAYRATPEYDRMVAESLKWFDRCIAFDYTRPDSKDKARELEKEAQASANILARMIIPNFVQVWSRAYDLETEIDAVLKGK